MICLQLRCLSPGALLHIMTTVTNEPKQTGVTGCCGGAPGAIRNAVVVTTSCRASFPQREMWAAIGGSWVERWEWEETQRRTAREESWGWKKPDKKLISPMEVNFSQQEVSVYMTHVQTQYSNSVLYRRLIVKHSQWISTVAWVWIHWPAEACAGSLQVLGLP